VIQTQLLMFMSLCFIIDGVGKVGEGRVWVRGM